MEASRRPASPPAVPCFPLSPHSGQRVSRHLMEASWKKGMRREHFFFRARRHLPAGVRIFPEPLPPVPVLRYFCNS